MVHNLVKRIRGRPVETASSPPAEPVPRRSLGRISLLKQMLLAILVAGLVPLILISYSALVGYTTASQKATASAVELLDDKSLEALQTEAIQTAADVARFLEARVDDTLAATLIPRTPEAFLAFYHMHESDIRYPTGSEAAMEERRERLPLYREMAFIDRSGRERLRIVDGQILRAEQLRDVSDPANTTYKTETYFAETRSLPAREVFVSPVTAWHTSAAEQPAGAAAAPSEMLEGAKYGRYEAVVRFGTPIYDVRGDFDGMVLLSLDHRHIIEYVIHVQPAAEQSWTLYPDYRSGNYAFLFDQEGYTVAHPLLSRMRGLDANGHLVPDMAAGMTPEEQQRHPFNSRYAAWSDANLPKIYEAVLRNENGFAITVNRAGARKASTYAPIPFAHGAYRQTGYFGGIVIGANVEEFHKAATVIRENIQNEQRRQESNMLSIAVGGVALLAAVATFISRSITRPMHHLADAARAMEQGELDSSSLDAVLRRRIQDEVTKLAHVFKRMAEQVQLREHNLKQQIVHLRIQIDEQKQQQDTSEITETSYFQDLAKRAETMRKQFEEPESSGE